MTNPTPHGQVPEACTCPSGDGSLRWPCPAHPATQQAGWTNADADAARLALELECLLMDTKDTAAVSKWWQSANEALELHRARLQEVQPSPTTQAADSVLEDVARRTTGQEHAIRQGHEIAASDGYFEARPQIDSNDRRKVFQAGFERGWDAASKQGENHD